MKPFGEKVSNHRRYNMSTNIQINNVNDPNAKPPKPKTLAGEWIAIAIIIVVVIILILILFLVIKPNLYKSSSAPVNNPLLHPLGCPTSPPPTNIAANQFLFTRANMALTWTAVLTTTTPGQTILGYNIYIGTSPGVTSNIGGIYTPVALKTVYVDSSGASLVGGKTYYINVATVDTCGSGLLGTEISFTPTQT